MSGHLASGYSDLTRPAPGPAPTASVPVRGESDDAPRVAGASSPARSRGKEPTPGSAAAVAAAARESDDVGAVVAGTSSDPAYDGVGPSCARTSGSCPGDERGVTCRVSCGELTAGSEAICRGCGETHEGLTAGSAPMAAGFVLPRPPEFSMRSALNAALNRRT